MMRKQLGLFCILIALVFTYVTARAQQGSRLMASLTFVDTSSWQNGTGYTLSDSTYYSYPSITTDKCWGRYRKYVDPYYRYSIETTTLLAYLSNDSLCQEIMLENLSNGSDDTIRCVKYAYNSTGSLTSYEMRYKDRASGNWFNSAKCSFIRDTKDFITDSIYQYGSPDSSNWLMQSAKRCSYVRDSNGRLSKKVLSTFDNTVGWYQELDDDTTEYAYDGYGRVMQQTNHSWCPNISPSRLTSHRYFDGRPSIQFFDTYDRVFGWMPVEKVVFEYDSIGNNTQRLHFYWSQTITGQNVGVYYPHHKDSIAYNAFRQCTFQAYLSSVNYSDSIWQRMGDYYCYYYDLYQPPATSIVNVTQNRSDARVVTTPNPANTFIDLSIQWNVLQPFIYELSDVTGRMHRYVLMQASKDSKAEIDVSHLPAGIYLLSIHGQKGFQFAKRLSIVH